MLKDSGYLKTTRENWWEAGGSFLTHQSNHLLMVEPARGNWSNYLCLAIKFLTSRRCSSNCSWYDDIPQFQSLSTGNGLVAVLNNYILYHFESHKQKSHWIFCFYNWWENSDKISNVVTSLLIPRQRFNMVWATKNQYLTSHQVRRLLQTPLAVPRR